MFRLRCVNFISQSSQVLYSLHSPQHPVYLKQKLNRMKDNIFIFSSELFLLQHHNFLILELFSLKYLYIDASSEMCALQWRNSMQHKLFNEYTVQHAWLPLICSAQRFAPDHLIFCTWACVYFTAMFKLIQYI